MPFYAMTFMVFTLANVGLPGTSGFVGEFLSLLAVFRTNTTVAVIATLGIILSAAYALWLYRRVVFGVVEKPGLLHIPDMNAREMAALVPLIVFTVYFGFYPNAVLDVFASSVDALLSNLNFAGSVASTPVLSQL